MERGVQQNDSLADGDRACWDDDLPLRQSWLEVSD